MYLLLKNKVAKIVLKQNIFAEQNRHVYAIENLWKVRLKKWHFLFCGVQTIVDLINAVKGCGAWLCKRNKLKLDAISHVG